LLGVITAALSPGLTLAERIAAPCAVILTTALVHAFVVLILGGLARLSITILKVYGYLFLFGGMLSILWFPLLLAGGEAEVFDSPFARAMGLSGILPMGVAVSWAAAIALGKERLLPDGSVDSSRDS
jgi:hypothetical protein